MQPLPHNYDVTVSATESGPVQITSPGLSALASAPPVEFDGPGTLWSPETLVVAAVSDCLALTFRAVAGAAKLQWRSFVCNARGAVDRIDGVTRFAAVRLRVQLSLPAGADEGKARKILEKAEAACLVGNSLKCDLTLEIEVTVDAPALAPCA